MKTLKAQAEQKGYHWIDWNVCAEDATASHPDAAQILRNIRRDANDTFKKMEKNDEISEDDLKDAEEKIQKITDKAIEKIDKAVENKTKEILTV